MLNEGQIQSFLDIFQYIPKSVVAADLGKKVDRFTELMNKIEKFTVEELLIIAGFCNLSISEMFKLVENEYVKRQNKKLKV
ncbi:MAG TPA: hypothetical protein VNW04_00035 [Puia sp.]|nr:hypothetical protein [Puia sp.]